MQARNLILEWRGSLISVSGPRAMRAQPVQWLGGLGGSGGIHPQEFFLILDVLRSILLLLGTLFYHGKANVIAVV